MSVQPKELQQQLKELQLKELQLKAEVDYFYPRILRWLFADVIWATLPLWVLAMIGILVPEKGPAEGMELRSFWTNAEWSFASITLFAACLREMLRVKMEVQRDSFVSTSSVIGAVVALIVLNTTLLGFVYSERLGATISLFHVTVLQKFFFGSALVLTVLIFRFETSIWTVQAQSGAAARESRPREDQKQLDLPGIGGSSEQHKPT